MFNDASSEAGNQIYGVQGFTLETSGETVDTSNIEFNQLTALNLTSAGDTTLSVKADSITDRTFTTADTEGADVFQSAAENLFLANATLTNWDTLENTQTGTATTTVSGEQLALLDAVGHADADGDDTLTIKSPDDVDATSKTFTNIDTLTVDIGSNALIVDANALSQLATVSGKDPQASLASEEQDFDLSGLEVLDFNRVVSNYEGDATITVGENTAVLGYSASEGHSNTLRTTHTELNLAKSPVGGPVALENIDIITTTNTTETHFTGVEGRSETFVGGTGADTFSDKNPQVYPAAIGPNSIVTNHADTLTGGAGNDTFMDVNGDTITDFGEGDIIRVSRMEPKIAINALSTSVPHPDPEPQPELSASEHLLFENGVLKVDANMDGDFDDTASGLDIAVSLQGLSGGTFSVTNEGGNSDITWTAPAPSSGGGGGGTPTNSRTSKVDGATVNKSTTTTNGRTQEVTEIVPTDETREDDPNTENGSLADVPLAQDEGVDTPALKVGLPTGVGMRAEGAPTRLSKQDALNDLITRIQQKTPENSAPQEEMTGIGQSFLNELPEDSQLFVKTVTPTVAEGAQLGSPITITGAGESQTGNQQEALVIDASSLPSGTVLQLDDVNFAAIVGEAQVIGGTGRNVVTGDDNAQYIVLGEDDDVLYGGGGDDVVGSKGGDDRLFGGSGNDELFGGADADLLHGGNDTDKARYDGNRDDYIVTQEHGVITIQAKNDANDIDKLVNIEILSFADGEESITYDDDLAWITGLYDQVLGRQGDVEGVQYWAKQHAEGLSRADVAMLFITSSEADQDLNLAVDGTDGVLDTLYQSLLGREADAPGKAYWANELENGSSLRDVAGGFMASEEMRTHDLIDTQWDFIA